MSKLFKFLCFGCEQDILDLKIKYQLMHNIINHEYPSATAKIYENKNKNCRFFLNQWIKTTNQQALALNNCYSITFHKKVKRNGEIQEELENLKFNPITMVINMVPNKTI